MGKIRDEGWSRPEYQGANDYALSHPTRKERALFVLIIGLGVLGAAAAAVGMLWAGGVL